MPELTVREWSAAQWADSCEQWNALLKRSGLDALFLSWQWLTTWWQHFGRARGHDLHIVTAYREDVLVGVAPLYICRAIRRMLPVRSLQFVGVSWRDENSVASPYLDFVAADDDREAVRAAILEHLARSAAWSELIVGLSMDAKGWERVLERHELSPNYHRAIDRSTSYQADLRAGFGAYLASLGQSTRRSLWHLRRRLSELGWVHIEHVQREGIAGAFDHLNRLHQLRWGKPAFADARLGFHLDVAADLLTRNELVMSMLRIDDQVVSVIYDIRKGDCQYNLKMAFDPNVERNFSLGLIHFGYAIEAAANRGVVRYDFLAGPGQRTDFKSSLAQQRRELATVQMLKGPILRRLYRWHDGQPA